MLRLIAPIAAIALAMLSASPAMAAPRDTDVPRPDPPGRWRVIDHTDEKSTSKCIGNPITPLCAIETDRACRLRHAYELCAVAAGREGVDSTKALEEIERRLDESLNGGLAELRKRDLDGYEKFRVVAVERVRAVNLSRHQTPVSRRGEPYRVDIGDIVVVINEVNCWRLIGPRPGCSSPSVGLEWKYFLRKTGARWTVVDLYDAEIDY